VSLSATVAFTVLDRLHSFFSLMGAISATDWVVGVRETVVLRIFVVNETIGEDTEVSESARQEASSR